MKFLHKLDYADLLKKSLHGSFAQKYRGFYEGHSV